MNPCSCSRIVQTRVSLMSLLRGPEQEGVESVVPLCPAADLHSSEVKVSTLKSPLSSADPGLFPLASLHYTGDQFFFLLFLPPLGDAPKQASGAQFPPAGPLCLGHSPSEPAEKVSTPLSSPSLFSLSVLSCLRVSSGWCFLYCRILAACSSPTKNSANPKSYRLLSLLPLTCGCIEKFRSQCLRGQSSVRAMQLFQKCPQFPSKDGTHHVT
ncbi:hypothetical protein JZ751_023125 [Albula glossodonta]|uniref:Uncharacterized protein n=1 Tax=Albula glossodonta TaxID=121402 RepID=A0A8T2PHB0_9TELE|nr:hypothetical protein JZ751_023125 [Albula glossodonta]